MKTLEYVWPKWLKVDGNFSQFQWFSLYFHIEMLFNTLGLLYYVIVMIFSKVFLFGVQGKISGVE